MKYFKWVFLFSQTPLFYSNRIPTFVHTHILSVQHMRKIKIPVVDIVLEVVRISLWSMCYLFVKPKYAKREAVVLILLLSLTVLDSSIQLIDSSQVFPPKSLPLIPCNHSHSAFRSHFPMTSKCLVLLKLCYCYSHQLCLECYG